MFRQTEDLKLRDYVRPIVVRKWLILAIVVLVTVAAYVYYAQKPEVYSASTKLLIEATLNPLSPSASELSDRAVNDQATLLTSRDVATAVARRLGRPDEASELAGSIVARPVSGSNFVILTAHRSTGEDAAAVANEFARAFIQLRSDAARETTQTAIDKVRAQLAALPHTPANATDRRSLEDSLRQLRLTLTASSGSATQVDPAGVPASAIAPHPVRNTILAFLVSLAGAVGLAYALEALDRRIRRLEEFGPLYSLPVMAVLPRSKDVDYRENGHAALSPMLTEPFRQIRTNLQLAGLDKPLKRILVTSAVAGEGKSTVVRNLALVLREGGLHVAVVDTDLRQRALARFFDQKSEPGLTNVLTGRQPLAEAMVSVPVEVRGLGTLTQIQAVATTGTSNGAAEGPEAKADVISLLASGPQPADPQAVLSAERTRGLLDEIAAEHDVVLIDSAPLLHVTDAVALLSWVDAVIVVARLGAVTRDHAGRLTEVLKKVPGVHPIGVVVNDVPAAEGTEYGYSYSYGYGG